MNAQAQHRLPTAGRRALALVLLMAALALVAASEDLHAALLAFLPAGEAIIQQRPVLGILFFIGFAALSAMLAFVSSVIIVPVGIYVWGAPISMLLLWAGWTLGGLTAYGIGRFLGREVVNTLSGSTPLEPYERFLSRRAPFGLVLLFQTAMPSEVPGYLLGLLRYPVVKYLAALVLAELPYAVATVYVGTGFIERRTHLLVGMGATIIAFSGWAIFTLRRRLRRAAEEEQRGADRGDAPVS